MNTEIAMWSKGSGIIVEISPRLPTGWSHIPAELAILWWLSSARHPGFNVNQRQILNTSLAHRL